MGDWEGRMVPVAKCSSMNSFNAVCSGSDIEYIGLCPGVVPPLSTMAWSNGWNGGNLSVDVLKNVCKVVVMRGNKFQGVWMYIVFIVFHDKRIIDGFGGQDGT
jgi:hypothetical protein